MRTTIKIARLPPPAWEWARYAALPPVMHLAMLLGVRSSISAWAMPVGIAAIARSRNACQMSSRATAVPAARNPHGPTAVAVPVKRTYKHHVQHD
jgi:hypothetical protein